MTFPFYKITLPCDEQLFAHLHAHTRLETITKGMLGNTLIKKTSAGIPLVRTTSQYQHPAQAFLSCHQQIVDHIKTALKQQALPETDFNNALAEVYDASYSTMKYHSDQCLDIKKPSCIALFSCYEYPDLLTGKHIRTLRVKHKNSDEQFDIPLTHNSVVIFSTDTNAQYHHKIILQQKPSFKKGEIDNKWFGLTFRESKTFINFKNDQPYFSNGHPLTFATEPEQKQYYKLRGEENKRLEFNYPPINYTLSAADLLEP